MRGKKLEVRWTDVSEKDLWEVIAHIALEHPSTAEEFLKTIRSRAEALETLPRRGRVVPELDRLGIRDYREIIVVPWRIVYKVDPARVEVLAVLDSRRNVEDLLLKRLTRNP